MARTVVGLDIGRYRCPRGRVPHRSPDRRPARVRLGGPAGGRRPRTAWSCDPDAVTGRSSQAVAQGKFSTKNVVLGHRQRRRPGAPDGSRLDAAGGLPQGAALPGGRRAAGAGGRGQPGLLHAGRARADHRRHDDVQRVARVMLVAAGREMVDTFVRSVQAAGLRPVRVDLLPFALVRAASPVVGDPGSDAPLEAIVDIGADTVGRGRAPGRTTPVRAHPGRTRWPCHHPGPDGALRLDLGGGRAHQDQPRPARPCPPRRPAGS